MNNDLNEMRQKAMDFRKRKDYDSAYPLFEKLWNSRKETESKDNIKWDGWGYALCLNHFKKYDMALQVCKEVYKIDKNFNYIKGVYAFCLNQFKRFEEALSICKEVYSKTKTNKYIISTYAWAAYNLYINKFDIEKGNIEELLKYAKGIIDLTRNTPEDLARIETVLKIIDNLEAIGKWNDVLEWSKYLSPEKLNTEKYNHTLPDGKRVALPSPKEKWFSKVTKAYEKLARFQECLDLTNQALEFLPDDVWLTRRRAICLDHLGQNEESLKLLTSIASRKKEWFIFKDIASIHYEKNDLENALKYCYESSLHAIRNPKQENLWELYFMIAQIHKRNNNSDKAKKYCLLSGLLRTEHEWKIPPKLQELALELKVNFDQTQNSVVLIKELSKDWAENKYSGKEIKSGIIKTIMPSGKSGFISTGTQPDYFFRMSEFKGNKKYCVEKTKVTFYLEKSFDKKKNKETEIAVNINVAE
ncbi:MAG: hypothetical protein HUU54_08480 [Ignavibacteriaceae bacterium]|nr:hypothetical protein [Ignavibacteriaceae bacterium]